MNKTEHKIHILPEYIANQIAAGEVVQRPESVVKELVENSLDANATEIGVFVRDAGKQLIHVIDNGFGMSREDLELSIKRHSTSKIYTPEDLEEIKSFGFRGEALASICSVASLEIRTKRESDSHGWKLLIEPMKQLSVEPCYNDKGTQVFVRNLFFNVPARRKFLRSNLTEFRYISETMFKFALSHPEIAFTFYDADTLIFNLKPATLIERIIAVFNPSIRDSLIPVYSESEFIKVNGYIGSPSISKLNQTVQYLFLNRRSIRSKSLSHSILSAYEHIIEKNSYPLYILNIEVDPKSVDVNVHPQKYEVKFDDERMVYGFIHKAVSNALQNFNFFTFDNEKYNLSQIPVTKINIDKDNQTKPTVLINKLTGEIIEENKFYNKELNFKSDSDNKNYTIEKSLQNKSINLENVYKNIEKFNVLELNSIPNNEFVNKKQFLSFWQAHNKYIFIQTHNSIFIIDQHAAHERILYEKALRAMNKEYAYSQEILFPINISLNSIQMSALKEIEKEIQSLGFYYTMINNSELIITSVPSDIQNGEEEISFKTIINEFIENQEISSKSRIDTIAATFSCKLAIKTGQKLSDLEIDRLMKDLFECKIPHVCPHGRPTIIELSLKELDKRFHRM